MRKFQNNQLRALLLIMVLALGTAGCKNRRAISEVEKPENLKAKELRERIAANALNYTTLSGKFSASVKTEKRNTSVNVNFRMKKDSLIWLSVSPALGIEVFRIRISPDSIHYIDKLHNTYYRGDYSIIDSLLKTHLSFNFIEKFLTGNALLPDDARYSSDVEGKQYVLKSRVRQMESYGEPQTTGMGPNAGDVTITYWINSRSFRIERAQIKSENRPESILVVYDNFTDINGQKFPQSAAVLLNSPLESASFELSFSRIRINEPESFPFKFPSSYSPVE